MMDKTITKIAVCGAGVMGTAIAACGARAGLDVVLLDPVTINGVPGHVRAKEAVTMICKKGTMKGSDTRRIKAGIVCPEWEKASEYLQDCDLIVEAVLETLEVKRSTMTDLFNACGPETIIGTNTSNISIADIAEEFPEDWQRRFMGIHFFNPVRYMDLVEVIPHAKNEEATIKAIEEFLINVYGKTAIRCKDEPGFIANRIGSMALTSVMNATLEMGYTFPKADALTGDLIFRPKQGAFKLMDMVGLDICDHTCAYMSTAKIPEYEKPFRNRPETLAELIANGTLGDKTKAGFYKRGKGLKAVWDREKKEYVPYERETIESIKGMKGVERLRAMLFTDLPESPFVRKILIDPLWLAMMACEDISYGFSDIDDAMRGGYSWLKGPFQIVDEIGPKEFIDLMKKEGYEVPKWVEEKIAADGKFYAGAHAHSSPYLMLNDPKFNVIEETEDAVLKDIGDGIACFSLKTKANSCTIGGAKMMKAMAEEIEKSKAFKAMVIANPGANFGVGANLGQVGEAIMAGNFDELEESVKTFQEANMAIKYMKKPVVAAANGKALGGSAEILLHCDRVVAPLEIYAGLVEMGVGLVPSGGGCAELLFRKTEGLKYGQMAQIISKIDEILLPVAQAQFSMSAEDAMKRGYMRRGDAIIPKQAQVFEKAKKMACALAECGYLPPVKGTVTAAGEHGYTHLMATVNVMLNGRMMTPYDAVIVEKLARIFTGGDALSGEQITEADVLYLERKAFMELCHNEKTQERIKGMLMTGKPVRN